ncbi:MAG: hypothetical protein LC790_22845, partial [Actinobacteria bacterium]|nr:hypothetical protein [Actinomycetota bacterium]
MTPKYPIAVCAAALATAAAVLVPGTSAQSPGAQSDAPDVLTVQFRHREAKVRLVDLPPKMTRRRPSESPGDLAVGSARLRNASG